MLFKSNKIIGLDIGTSSIKLVEVERSKRKVSLSSFAFTQTPPGSIVAGEIINPEALTDAVRGLVAQTKTKRKKTCVGIWGTAIVVKKINMPRMDASIAGEQVRWEAEQFIPFDINEVNLEFHILRGASASPDQMSVLVVAAKRDFVLRYAEVVEAAGLECAIVDVAGFALQNAFEYNYGQQPGTVGLLNIGAGVSNFVVVESGEVGFSRDIPVGGLTYTNEIQKALPDVSFEEAESLKISASSGQGAAAEVEKVIKETNEMVAEEIHRSVDFYAATAADTTIQRLVVTGGGVGTSGLIEHVGATLGMPVEIFNPFANVQYNTKVFTPDYISQISPYAGVGLGLALRQAGDR